MDISVALFAYLSQYQPDGLGGRQPRAMRFAQDTSVGDVIGFLGLPNEPRVVFVNGRHAEDESLLSDGDRLAIFPPVAGG